MFQASGLYSSWVPLLRSSPQLLLNPAHGKKEGEAGGCRGRSCTPGTPKTLGIVPGSPKHM